MDIKTCVNTLRSLAEGLDPLTGRPLTAASITEQDSVRDSLLQAADFMTRFGAQQSSPKTSRGRAWTSDEESRLVREFESGRSIEAISTDLHRSSSAIQARLFRLGKL
ncbi:MAG: hypothetical protein IT290_11270, partial [Deltaproteobacteria bacterium]|nr:hypothetical protein [Deltaproteobacteria bacterium]